MMLFGWTIAATRLFFFFRIVHYSTRHKEIKTIAGYSLPSRWQRNNTKRLLHSTMSSCSSPDGPFVTSEWLYHNLSRVKVVDASWRFSPDGKTSSFYREFLEERIPNARYFDIEKAVREDDDVPHLLPSSLQFGAYVGTNVGASNEDTLVVYSRPHWVGAARVWWMFRVFGMPENQVFILRGGLEDWKKHGYPIASSHDDDNNSWMPSETNKTFVARYQPQFVADQLLVKEYVQSPRDCVILDARSSGRFHGTEPEPRAGVPRGHVDTAINIPFVELLTQDGQDILDKEELKQIFQRHGVVDKRNVICMCGSGVTATVVHVALQYALQRSSRVYDGSWMDWTKKHRK